MIKYQVQGNNLQTEFTFHEEMAKETAGYFKNKLGNILVGHRTKSVVVLIPTSDRNKEGIETYVDISCTIFQKSFPLQSFLLGLAKSTTKLVKRKPAIMRPYTALRMATRKNKIILFDSLGMVGPLINQNNEKEIRRLARHLLGALVENVDHKKLDLIKTLYLFLENGGNLEQTASDTALSLSGLRYRISRIEELLKHNLRDPFYNYQLYLALQSLILIGELELNLT